jgi:hypothetical protein
MVKYRNNTESYNSKRPDQIESTHPFSIIHLVSNTVHNVFADKRERSPLTNVLGTIFVDGKKESDSIYTENFDYKSWMKRIFNPTAAKDLSQEAWAQQNVVGNILDKFYQASSTVVNLGFTNFAKRLFNRLTSEPWFLETGGENFNSDLKHWAEKNVFAGYKKESKPKSHFKPSGRSPKFDPPALLQFLSKEFISDLLAKAQNESQAKADLQSLVETIFAGSTKKQFPNKKFKASNSPPFNDLNPDTKKYKKLFQSLWADFQKSNDAIIDDGLMNRFLADHKNESNKRNSKENSAPAPSVDVDVDVEILKLLDSFLRAESAAKHKDEDSNAEQNDKESKAEQNRENSSNYVKKDSDNGGSLWNKVFTSDFQDENVDSLSSKLQDYLLNLLAGSA